MGLDIRELRIGSHVLYNGERVEVWSIEKECGCYGITVHNKAKKYEDNMFHSSKEPYLIQTGVERLKPIPITEELLTELGFEKSTDNIIGVPIFAKTMENDFHIEVKKFHGYDEWRLHVDDCDRDSVGFLDVHYLHEAEAFVYLTTKQELI